MPIVPDEKKICEGLLTDNVFFRSGEANQRRKGTRTMHSGGVMCSTDSYWGGGGKYSIDYDRLVESLPLMGKASTAAGEIVRAANKLLYEFHNNGMLNETSCAIVFLEEVGVGNLDEDCFAAIYKYASGFGEYYDDEKDNGPFPLYKAIERMVDRTMEFILARPELETLPTSIDYRERSDGSVLRGLLHLTKKEFEIVFLDASSLQETRMKAEPLQATMKGLFSEYAKQQGVPLSSLRFSHDGKTMFMSEFASKSPFDACIKHNDVVRVTSALTSAVPQDVPTNNQNSNNKSKKSKSSSRKGKNKQKKKSSRPIIQTKKSDKEEHSKILTQLFREAEPKFKALRHKLNVMTLERTQPKKKSTKKTVDVPNEDPPAYYSNINLNQTDAKASKSSFLVQVGQIDNLYKTRKPSQAPKRALTLDLRGLSSNEALTKLDANLIKWIDIAMEGSYPWVIPVVIVCGKGKILSDTVEKWIKSNDNVANAPKK